MGKSTKRRFKGKRDLALVENEEEKHAKDEKDEMKLLGLIEKELLSDNGKLLTGKKKRRSTI